MGSVYGILSTINTALQKIEKALGCISLAVLFFVMIANAALRYLFQSGLNWSDELNGFLFVWFSFLAASYAMSSGAHLSVTFLVELFPKSIQLILRCLMNLIMIGFFLLYMPALNKLLNTLPISNVMRIPMEYVYFILPFSFVLMCYHLIFNIFTDVRSLTSLKNKKEEIA